MALYNPWSTWSFPAISKFPKSPKISTLATQKCKMCAPLDRTNIDWMATHYQTIADWLKPEKR